METQINAFHVTTIKYPLQMFKYVKPIVGADLAQYFKAELIIVEDTKLLLTFGVQVTLEEEINIDPKDQNLCGLVEASAVIQIDGKIGKPKDKQDIPMLPNMLAFIYPFIREKIHTGFACNTVDIFLPSMNFYSFVDDVLEGLEIKDQR